MEYDKNICPVVDIDGVIASGKQFDLDITLPKDNRNVIYGIVKDCHKEPIRDAVVKLIEVIRNGYDKEERRPVSHTFTDKEGEFVFGPLCPDKYYEIQIWVDQVKHAKICATCDHEGACLRGVKIDCKKTHNSCKEYDDCNCQKCKKNKEEEYESYDEPCKKQENEYKPCNKPCKDHENEYKPCDKPCKDNKDEYKPCDKPCKDHKDEYKPCDKPCKDHKDEYDPCNKPCKEHKDEYDSCNKPCKEHKDEYKPCKNHEDEYRPCDKPNKEENCHKPCQSKCEEYKDYGYRPYPIKPFNFRR